MPLGAKTDLEITVLADLISLTPGPLSLDVSPPKAGRPRRLYVYAVYLGDGADDLKWRKERRVLRPFPLNPAGIGRGSLPRTEASHSGRLPLLTPRTSVLIK